MLFPNDDPHDVSPLEFFLLCVFIAVPPSTFLVYIIWRVKQRSHFERVSSSGAIIDMRLDIEDHGSEALGTDQYHIRNGEIPLASPNAAISPVIMNRLTSSIFTPIHLPGRNSTDNPFRRINSPGPSPRLQQEQDWIIGTE